MKHKYKINIDQPLPSDDKIGRHKDFGRILADYHNLTQPIYRKPLYKNPKAFLGVVMIVTIALLVFWAVEEEDQEKAKQEQMEKWTTEMRLAQENSFLKPPVPVLQVPAVKMEADAAQSQVLKLPNGLEVKVPADAFETEDGKPVTGNVDVEVRTLQSPAEMIAMGLPMEARNRLIHPLFVVDVKATQGGAQLRLRTGKVLDVQWPLNPGWEKAQHLFALDIQSRSWQGGENPAIQPILRKGNVASMGQEDGFGVVQYDENGKVIPQRRPASDTSAAQIKVMQFQMNQLGIIALGESAGLGGNAPLHKLHFTDAGGKTLRVLTLYSMPTGLNTVQFLWPQDTSFTFEAHLMAGTTTMFAGFLPDGRLGITRAVTVQQDTQKIHTLVMEISDQPIQDLKDLTQRLAAPGGQ
jgi:hypothetical protein